MLVLPFHHVLDDSFQIGFGLVRLTISAADFAEIVEHDVHIEVIGRHKRWCGTRLTHTGHSHTGRDSTRGFKFRSCSTGADWLHEIKHDGFRLIARRDGARVRLFTRNGNDWTERYPV